MYKCKNEFYYLYKCHRNRKKLKRIFLAKEDIPKWKKTMIKKMCASSIKVTIKRNRIIIIFPEVQIRKRMLKIKDDDIDQVRVNLRSSAMTN